MYFAKILSGVAVEAYTASCARSVDDHEITREQFANCEIPCHAVNGANGVILGAKVRWEDVPNTGTPTERPEPEPIPVVPTEIELAQQDITDLQLSDIEQGQQMTDLELTILGGSTNV